MKDDSLWNMKAADLLELMEAGEVSSREVVRAFLDRIGEVEPEIGAFLDVMREEALAQALRIDELRRSGGRAGLLGGVPVAVKDNVCVKGARCTCGSRLLANWVAPYDATVVEALRRQGAIIIGKTNMDEFAMGSSTENSALGLTRNPWDICRVPGGSSGGSAAAVAAGEVPLALGSDTGGSVRQPASFTGIVGLKPTYGTVSRYGLVAFASSLDQIGPLAADVRDVCLLMDVISGFDDKDSTSENRMLPSYTRSLSRDPTGLRAAVPKECLTQGVSRGVRECFERALEVLEDLGISVEETSLPMSRYALDCYYIIATAEASSNLSRFDGVRYGVRAKAENLEEMYMRTRRNFGPEVKRRIMLGTFALSAGYYDAYYLRAAKVRTLIRRDFKRVFDEFDIIVSPTTPTSAFLLGERTQDPLSMYMADVLTVPANLAGLPALSVPCGFEDVPRSGAGDGNDGPHRLPVGLQITGKAFDEETVLCAGHAFYQIVAPAVETQRTLMRKYLGRHTQGRTRFSAAHGGDSQIAREATEKRR